MIFEHMSKNVKYKICNKMYNWCKTFQDDRDDGEITYEKSLFQLFSVTGDKIMFY